ncbi:MAG TPA: tetratricopeptide repeat protein [Opitutaceae bacterium]|nr:tetratricopeptide repeat protein [Opitutaceae bacterium]
MPSTVSRLVPSLVLGAGCALVVALYAVIVAKGVTEWSGASAAENPYNLLVAGFRAGHLSVAKEVPAGLAKLADPYDPAANAAYRSLPIGLHDLSYYQGRLFLYFGITPALLLFWPWVALTGHFLLQRYAVAVFCAVGFLASTGLLRALWRRYFPEVGVASIAAGVLGLGLVTAVPVMLQRAELWEVAIGCGYALVMLALAAIWRALHDAGRRVWWVAAASLALGLAVGARPSLLFSAMVLLVPVALAWRQTAAEGARRPWGLLAAAVLPLALCGLGLMLYNQLRFDSPFDFGQRYQLAGDRQEAARYFSPRYFWFNIRVYFLEPVRWYRHLPFAGGIVPPPLPPGHAPVEDAFGVLANLPVLWFALAAPLAWRGRAGAERTALRAFVAAVALVFAVNALVLCGFYGNCSRYEVEFLPALALLAATGVLGLERALSSRPRWRRAMRVSGGLLLTASVAFILLTSLGRYAIQRYLLGNHLLVAGQKPEAIAQYEAALRADPGLVDAESGLGNALLHAGRAPEAIAHFERAVRLRPDRPEVYVNLANVRSLTGDLPAAISSFEAALRLEPNDAETHFNLAAALAQMGRMEAAQAQFEAGLRLKPPDAEALANWGGVLLSAGHPVEAMAQFESALRLQSDSASNHYGYGSALATVGRLDEAVRQFEAALRLKPDYVEAHNNLGIALTLLGREAEALPHYEAALRLSPDQPSAHNNLGLALARLGRLSAAAAQFAEALRLAPDYQEARDNLARAQEQLRASPP